MEHIPKKFGSKLQDCCYHNSEEHSLKLNCLGIQMLVDFFHFRCVLFLLVKTRYVCLVIALLERMYSTM
jgi:hypothetical protein